MIEKKHGGRKEMMAVTFADRRYRTVTEYLDMIVYVAFIINCVLIVSHGIVQYHT